MKLKLNFVHAIVYFALIFDPRFHPIEAHRSRWAREKEEGAPAAPQANQRRPFGQR